MSWIHLMNGATAALVALVLSVETRAATDPVTTDGINGVVRSAHVDGSTVRLTLDDDPRRVQVVLILGWLSNFPPVPEQYYLGKSITVRGRVQSFRDVSEIAVRDAADIAVHNAAIAEANPSDRREIEALHEQVRTLQERVHELEQHEPTR